MHSTEIDPVHVSGSEVSRRLSADGLTESYECTADASDERVSGTAIATVVLEHEPPTKMSGTYELTNEGGSWVGEITPDGNHIMEGVLEGTGDYEGLEYELRWEAVEEPCTIAGTIRARR